MLLGKPLLEPSLAVSPRNRGRVAPAEAGAAIVIMTGQAVQDTSDPGADASGSATADPGGSVDSAAAS